MNEYTIYNKKTGEEDIIFGTTEAKAFAKTDFNREEWIVTRVDFMD